MKRWRKTLVMLLAVCLIFSLATAALASSGETGASGEATASGEGGSSGGSSSSGGVDLSGMLALRQYVFVASQDEVKKGAVTTECYGAYAATDSVPAFEPEKFEGKLTVYTDSALTDEAKGVSAEVKDGSFTMTGVDEKSNTVYYLAAAEDAYATTIYVVCDEYDGETATLTLADGSEMTLTTYAPNMRFGDYRAVTDDDPINGSTAVYIGGNRTATALEDFTDPESFKGHEDAAAWFISSGITNAGDSLTRFGDKFYGYEYAMSLYRLFQIVVDQTTSAAGYTDPGDFIGAMMSNDPYSDAVSATLQAGIWNGIYTQYSDVKDLGEGFYLTENLPGVEYLGTGAEVTVEFAYVGLFNAFASPWTMLSEQGVETAAALAEKAAEMEGAAKTAPEDYSNETKLAAVSAVVLGEKKAPAADTVLTKAEAVELLYAVREDVCAKTAPDETRAGRTGSEYADMTRFFRGDYTDCVTVTKDNAKDIQKKLDTMDLISEEGAALLINNAGEFTITDNTVSLDGNADKAAADITALSDPRYALDGQEAATDPTHDGFVYNATSRNAFYRFGVGTALAVWGKDTVLDLRSTDGTLVLDGEAGDSSSMAGTMAGTAYVGFGGTLNVTNAVAYSSSQHLTNNLYNGTVIFRDAMAVGSGRVFSSDFWGGYQVFEDSIAAGGNVTDEPTTLIVKNGVFGNSVGGNGFASQYFENAVLNVSGARFQNTTSLVTDCGSLTLVNSVMNNSGSYLFSATGCERAILTLVDSRVSMNGDVLATVGNHEGVNNIALETVEAGTEEEYIAMWDGEVIVRFYGDCELDTATGTLTVEVAEGATAAVYSANLTEKDITNTGAGELIVVTAPAYGTVTVK